MTIVELIIVAALTLTLLSFLFFLLLLFLFIQTNQEVKIITRKRAKNAKRKRQLARKRKMLRRKKKKQKQLVITFLALAVLLGGASLSGLYYQANALSKEDETSVVKAYFLLNDFEKQLELAKTESEKKEKVDSNIRYLASAISSYGAKKASTLNSEQGQLTLNRYYKAMQDIGTNTMRVTADFYGNQELVEDYMEDVQRVRTYQKQVFELYKVDDAELENAKR
ncbi:hypothetical protein [Enterococcus crotali]|uniref:hypothetical protein n=1 Tax=Enterococcus crotali TaxID=1453587 RepID=UPI0004704F0A|nr:hypothetical protein [Enterococcus crotali]OTP49992.1 hypothetical protein A5881_001407 [Enterococcus termitis]